MNLKTRRKTQGFRCDQCSVSSVCLAPQLSLPQLREINDLFSFSTSFPTGEHFYYTKDPAIYCYAILSGSAKAYYLTPEGEEIITDFYLPGDIVGLEHYYRKDTLLNVRALEKTTVCLLPCKLFTSKNPLLLSVMLKQLAHRLLPEFLMPRMSNSRVQVVFVFFNFILKLRAIYPHTKQFVLPATLGDISKFIGIARENLSRILKELKEKNILIIKGRKIVFYDLGRLQDLLPFQHPYAPSLV